jgi:hypothetical protein
MSDTLKSVSNCARCGGTHSDLPVKRFERPVAPAEMNGLAWDRWATCPTTGDPILIMDAASRGVADVVEKLDRMLDRPLGPIPEPAPNLEDILTAWEGMPAEHWYPPPGFAPCTRPAPHDGPCAHPLDDLSWPRFFKKRD